MPAFLLFLAGLPAKNEQHPPCLVFQTKNASIPSVSGRASCTNWPAFLLSQACFKKNGKHSTCFWQGFLQKFASIPPVFDDFCFQTKKNRQHSSCIFFKKKKQQQKKQHSFCFWQGFLQKMASIPPVSGIFFQKNAKHSSCFWQGFLQKIASIPTVFDIFFLKIASIPHLCDI